MTDIESRIYLFWKIKDLWPSNWTFIDKRRGYVDDVIYTFNEKSIIVAATYRIWGDSTIDTYQFAIVGSKIDEFRSIVRDMKIKEIIK